jgi:predicted transcriptional regulator
MTKKPRPTQAEIEILGILWERGPSTVRQVHDLLGPERPGYTGVLKLMQNMHAKGLVNRETADHAHIYEAHEPQKMKSQLLGETVRTLFAGSASRLVLHLLEDKTSSPEEIAEIRRLLAAHKGRDK